MWCSSVWATGINRSEMMSARPATNRKCPRPLFVAICWCWEWGLVGGIVCKPSLRHQQREKQESGSFSVLWWEAAALFSPGRFDFHESWRTDWCWDEFKLIRLCWFKRSMTVLHNVIFLNQTVFNNKGALIQFRGVGSTVVFLRLCTAECFLWLWRSFFKSEKKYP